MKRKNYIYVIIFFLLLTLSVIMYVRITSKKISNENYINESLFDIYITNASNELTLIQIESMDTNNVKYSKIENVNEKYENACLLYIEKDSNGKVYVPYLKDINGNNKKSNRVLVFNKGILEDEIKFDDIRNPQNIISDIENNKIYVEQSITIQSSDSPGLKLKVIDSNSHKIINEIFLKGYITTYYIGDKEIILSLEGAHKLGFIDAKDRTLYAINRETLQGRVINKESLTNSVSGVCKDSKDNNIIFSNLSLKEDKNIEKNEIIIMNGEGEIKDNIEVNFDMFNNFYGNDKYEYILNGKYPYENNGFIVFNKENMNFEKIVNEVQNISYIESIEGYLFVLTVDSKLYIYDEKTLEKIDTIKFSDNRSCKMKVIKNN